MNIFRILGIIIINIIVLPFTLFIVISLSLLVLLNKLCPQNVEPITDPFEASEPSNMLNDFAV